MPGNRKALALRRAVQEALAVLPVRERAARLHRVMRQGPPSRTSRRARAWRAAKPASTSPNDHCVTGSPIGSWPSAAAAKSCAVHLNVLEDRRLGSRRCRSCARSGPPGYRLCSGSTVNGSSSYVTLICSSASLASSSVSAATARIGWPTNNGSFVRIVSCGSGGCSAPRRPSARRARRASRARRSRRCS